MHLTMVILRPKGRLGWEALFDDTRRQHVSIGLESATGLNHLAQMKSAPVLDSPGVPVDSNQFQCHLEVVPTRSYANGNTSSLHRTWLWSFDFVEKGMYSGFLGPTEFTFGPPASREFRQDLAGKGSHVQARFRIASILRVSPRRSG
jgi:hypothetical protein